MKLLQDKLLSHRDHPGLTPKEVIFRGRTPIEAKRQLIRYWSMNQDTLGLKLSEFLQRCTMMEDNLTIVFHAHSPKPSPGG